MPTTFLGMSNLFARVQPTPQREQVGAVILPCDDLKRGATSLLWCLHCFWQELCVVPELPSLSGPLTVSGVS